MLVGNVCARFKYGYCKYGVRCRKKHNETRCEIQDCDVSKCEQRHPHECKYYRDYKRCKFGSYCLYDHVDHVDPVLVELKQIKEKLDVLVNEIEKKNLEIKHLSEELEHLRKTHSTKLISNTPVTVSSSIPSMSTSATCIPASSQTSIVSPIPQFDGSLGMSSQPPDRKAQERREWLCKCCYYARNFPTETDLQAHHNKEHDEYEECNFCYPWHVWVERK